MLSPPRRVTLLVALTLFLAGGVLSVAQYNTLSTYESTTGTVETVGIENLSNDAVPSGLGAVTMAGETLYAPNVTYTYTVDGETYTSRNVAAGTDMVMGDQQKLAAALTSISPGTTTVYYHPDDPGDAHLLQHFDFFPAGILLMCGFLAMADTLTPRPRLIRLVTSMVPLETLEQLPGVDEQPMAGAVDDPMAVLSAKHMWRGIDPAPFRGGASTAVWLFCYLLIIDLVVGYLLLSSPPYDLWAAGAAFVVLAGLGRIAFTNVLQ